MRVLMMSTLQRGCGSKYTDDFKRKLVSESSTDGVSVPMVAKKHGVGTNRIYAWRGDGRFQPDVSDPIGFTPVDICDERTEDAPVPNATGLSDCGASPRIEITLENGRKLSVSDGVDAGFVLELARGLAA
jgi:transposase